MLDRRSLLTALTAVVIARNADAAESYSAFLASVAAQARRAGIRQATLNQALGGLQGPNLKVIQLDRHQPESTFTWQHYRDVIVSPTRVSKGRALYAQHRDLLAQVSDHYGVPAGILMGIWGLETDYGQFTGGFNVIDGLATLAWEGRRAAFFRSELMDALRILDAGDISAARMTGSYAGAMGQTQFMPDSFLKYAVDWSGTGRRDIWGDLGCVFASTANYLAREGWQRGLPWGERVIPPPGIDPYSIGHDHRMPVTEWVRLGVRRPDGTAPRYSAQAALLLPGGQSSPDAFLAYYPSYRALRSYNPPDFYCICVGLIGDLVVA